MKNLILVCLFFFVSEITLAQSKKEMIVILNNRVDSLTQIVASERLDKQKLNTEIFKLKSQIKELENTKEKITNQKNTEISKLKSQIEELESTNDNITNRKNTEISKLKSQIEELESAEFKITNQRNAEKEELQEAQLQMEELKKQLKIKQDSLVLVTTKLLNYKPAPPKEKLVVKKDIKGPIKTVTIGTQIWMKENLNVSTFKNGAAIPEVQDKDAWEKAGQNEQPAWCYYDNDPKKGAKFGKLYNWYAVIDYNGLCPQGWHVPSDDEWSVLISYLGGSSVAGGKMKEVGTTSWNDPNTAATNTSLFSALPGGAHGYSGDYGNIGYYGNWWSSTEDTTSDAWDRSLNYGYGDAGRDYYNKGGGLSVRCLRD